MTIKALLSGDDLDLDALAAQWPAGAVRVLRDGERHYLTSAAIDNPPTGKTYHEIAQRLIAYLNGLARARSSDFRPVRLSGTYEDDAGQQHAVAAVTLELRIQLGATMTVRRADGTIVSEPPSLLPDRLALTELNSDVAEALSLLGQAHALRWGDLWKVHEIIRESLRPDTAIALGWTTQDEHDSFGESANRPDVSGREARHARRPGQPKYPKFTLDEGISFIGNLVTMWLDYLR